MKEYSVLRVNGTPDWSSAEIAEINTPYLETPADIKAFAQLCYDSENIYVHLWAIEKDIRAVGTGPIDAPCEDSCLEFFFSPLEGDTRYFNIEFNPNCCVFLGMGSGDADLVRLLPEEGIASIFDPKASRTHDGWEIFYTVPARFVRQFFPDFALTPGKVMAANFYTCADLTTPAHYLSWNPVTGEPFSFHKPHCFGSIKLS